MTLDPIAAGPVAGDSQASSTPRACSAAPGSSSAAQKRRLYRNSCSFCGARLRTPAAGHCGAIFGDADGCGWVKAFRTLGIDEAFRQAKLPVEQRSAVA